MDSRPDTLPDTLNDAGVLRRREIEARILAPVIDALAEAFGREHVLAVVRDAIVRIAHQQGRQTAEAAGANTLVQFSETLAAWKKDDALEVEMLEQSEMRLEFNVTRCRYAELYQSLGIPELGAILSCNRDFAFIEGFNPAIQLTRTQTLLTGAPHCDFRFEK